MGPQKSDCQVDQKETEEQKDRTTESCHQTSQGQIFLQLLQIC